MIALLAAVGLVAAIACANVSAFLLARASQRVRQWAICRALGASGGLVIRELLAESGLVAVAGAAAGWVLAEWTLPILRGALPGDVPRLTNAALDGRTLVFTIAAAALAAAVAALATAVRLRGLDVTQALRAGGRPSSWRVMAGRGLVMGEVALAMVVVVTTGLLLRSLRTLDRLDLGFTASGVGALAIPIEEDRYPTIEAQRTYYQRMLDEVRSVPGVQSAAAILRRPLAGAVGLDTPFILEGQSPEAALNNPMLNVQVATPGALQTLGVALRKGRDFEATDSAISPPVVLVSENFAAWAWPGADPIGKRLRLAVMREPGRAVTPLSIVVGVTAEVRYRDLEAARDDIYLPMSQSTSHPGQIVVRTTRPVNALAPDLRRAIRSLEPNRIVSVTDLADVVARSESPWHATFTLSVALALIAVVLAIIGLSGTLLQHVASHRREIGIRVALGATPVRVVGGVVVTGLRLTGLGIGAGMAGAIALSRATRSLLFGVSPHDPITFVAAGALLVSVAFVVCLVPARRAALVDPLVALREE
jgi:predicted permease